MKPSKIYTLGDYYKDDLREVCRYSKINRCSALIELIIATFKDDIPEGSCLIPIPSRGYFPNNFTDRLCQVRPDLYLLQIFENMGILSFYCLKNKILNYRKVTLNDSSLRMIYPLDVLHLDQFKNIILVDDIIGTGCTMAKAMQLLNRQCEALCIAVDWGTFNNYNWNE